MTMGQLKSPLERYRMRAASCTIWLKAGWMKSANWISMMGSRPPRAMPMPWPTIEDSASGVSITRSSPNFSTKPSVARNTPPRVPTSSPMISTRSSPAMRSHMVSWMDLMRLFFAMACFSFDVGGRPCGALVGVDVAQRVLWRGIRGLIHVFHRLGKLRLDRVDQRLDPGLRDDPVLLQVRLEPRDWVQCPGLPHLVLGPVGAVVVV